MTDFRALCAELLEALENAIRVIYYEDGTKHISTADPVIAKADAALAQPEPQGLAPTPDDFRKWWRETGSASPAPTPEMLLTANAWAEHWAARCLRAQPEPQGPTDEELWSMYQEEARDFSPTAYARAILQRWGRPAIEPVPQQGE